MIAVAGLVLGGLLAWAIDGRWRSMQDVHFRFPALLFSAFVLQGVVRGQASNVLGGTTVPLWAGIGLVVLLLTWMQPRLEWRMPMLGGLGLNLLVVLVNEGMPVTAAAKDSAFYHPVSSRDALVVLADVVPAPFGWLVSLGDILLFVGLAVAVASSAVAHSDTGRSDNGRVAR